MSPKTKSEMMDMFALITNQGLTPNQFYLLYFIKEGVSPVHVNIHQEVRAVIAKGFLKDLTNAEGNKYELTPEAHTLIDQVESFFRVNKKKTNNQVMGAGYAEKVQEYLQVFPKMLLPSGKAARSDKKNVETALRWFIENYEYSWETIIKAAQLYVGEFELKNYLYMQTSQYFIRKQNADKTWASELANMCARVESGDIQSKDNHFSEKVV